MNYVFYDFETSGTNRYFDQPIQIAAALVNEDFEIIETFNETCKLKDGIVPNPHALLINKIKIDTLKNGQSFFEMVNKVHRKFTDWSPATFIGYNSLFFDEVVLRQSLYQSLYDPYLTNTNDNRRADLYHIMCAITKLKSEIIKLGFNPKTEKDSYKLEYLAIANNIEQKQAHDAMSDVYATIGLAKIIRDKASDFWNHCINISNPNNFLSYLNMHDIVFKAPSHPTHDFSPISFITANPERPKELSFFDLNHDIEKYKDSRLTGIISLIESKEKVIKILEINKAPIILGDDFINNSEVLSSKLKSNYHDKVNNIKTNKEFITKLEQALIDRSQDKAVNYPMPDFLETQIYSGFSGSADKEKMNNFRSTPDFNEKYIISKDFEDARYREIAYRILFNECPAVFSEDKLNERKQFFAQRALDSNNDVKWCTIDKARKAIESLLDDEDYKSDKSSIKEIELFINEEEEKYKEYLAS
mgnify:CR=1 FL=1